MGEVYRARDTKLNRDVAIKVLLPSVVEDPDRLARFGREAQLLASLNHPNIAHIHGIEDANGTRALVMELVEGPTLADRIAQGPFPLDEALRIAKQVAEALEAAHEQGIIHRDLKPANLKVRADGTVKVLDFGLAKAMDPVGASSANATNSPTLTMHATQAGVILGTAAYMSPEQARGKPVDKRADIWAFGCVFYEMVTGKRAFAGDDVSDVLASVLAREPDLALLPVTIPPLLDNYIRRCLHKDPRHRIHDIADVRLALESAFETTVVRTATPATSSWKGAPVAWVVTAAAVVAAGALALPAVRHLRETPSPAPLETRTEIVTPGADDLTSFALSPDGRQIVFVASGDGASRLWLRSLAITTAQPLPGTEGARFPFWAPDSRSIAFFAGGLLKRLDLGGGSPQSLAQVSNHRGGTWNTDGVILFSSSTSTLSMHMSGTGSAPTAATRPFPQTTVQMFPDFLPDGRRFLFWAQSGQDTTGIYLGTLDGSTPIMLTRADSSGVYLPAGWLLWVRESRLVAQRLDLAQAALTGELVTLADGVPNDGFGRSAVSVAATGMVAYRTGGGTQRQLTWVDRSGTVPITLLQNWNPEAKK